jgi:hypothetical protein
MWICKKCSEKIENEFDVCWNCGAEKGGAVVNKEIAASVKDTKAELKQEQEIEKNRMVLNHHDEKGVVIIDVQIPFWSLVILLLKLALASVPVVLILMALGGIFGGVIATIFR